MPRPHRIQVPGGVYHLTGRGNRRQSIFLNRLDHELFGAMLDDLAERRGWRGHAFCLMPNHYHLVVETPEADLSRGMQWLNGRYAQAFNHFHALDGHLFQGRFHSVLVESDWHLVELARYVALNPVRAGLCARPEDWRWSSYNALAGREGPRRFVDPDRVLGFFGRTRGAARQRFREFVADGMIRPQA